MSQYKSGQMLFIHARIVDTKCKAYSIIHWNLFYRYVLVELSYGLLRLCGGADVSHTNDCVLYDKK